MRMAHDQGSAEGAEPDTCRFEDLALPHLKALYRLAFRLTGETAAAEDLVLEPLQVGFLDEVFCSGGFSGQPEGQSVEGLQMR